MKKIFATLLAIACCVFWVGPLLAATGGAGGGDVAASIGGNGVGNAVSGFLTGVVFPFVGTLILGLLSLLVNRVSAKFKLGFIKDNEDFILGLAKNGIAIAEEKASLAVKQNVTKITGRDKVDIAIAHILERVPKMPQEKADKYVHAALARFEGVGANSKKTI